MNEDLDAAIKEAAKKLQAKLGEGVAIVVMAGKPERWQYQWLGPKLLVDGMVHRCAEQIGDTLWKSDLH